MVSCGAPGCTNRLLYKIVLCTKQLIEAYSGTFRNIQPCSSISRQIKAFIQALMRHTEQFLDLFRTLCNPCIYNRTIFRTLAYLEIKASSKTCQICKMISHIQSSGIVTTVYSSIFKDLQVYSEILLHIQQHSDMILSAKRCILIVWW